jgi:hypothetical protein
VAPQPTQLRSVLSVMRKERNQDDDWNRDAEKIE